MDLRSVSMISRIIVAEIGMGMGFTGVLALQGGGIGLLVLVLLCCMLCPPRIMPDFSNSSLQKFSLG